MKQIESLKTGSEFKQTPIGMIPVDWEVSTLGEISDEIYSYPTYFNIEYTQRGVPEIRGELIKPDGTLEIDLSKYRFISPQTASKFPKTSVKENDFVMSVRGTMGKIGIVPRSLEGANITANLIRISPRREKIYPQFLHQVFLGDRFISALHKASSSTTIKTIKAPELKSLLLGIPPHPEQKSIAEILTSVDNSIQKTDQIIQKINQLKKALMQQLLTKGIGHKEFKKTEIGKIPKEWKVKPLKDLAQIDRGKFQHRPRNEPRFYGGKYPFIQTGEVTNSGGRIKSFSQSLNEEGIKISRLFPKGTILITIAANIGETAITEFEVACPDSLIGIIAKNEIDNKFLEYYLRTRKEHLASLATQSAQKNINLETLKPYPVPIPSKEEQKNISEFFEGMEIFESKETFNLKLLIELKSSLMKELLTGRIRVF